MKNAARRKQASKPLQLTLIPGAAAPEHPARPFLKWAGGKGQSLTDLKRHLPRRYNRYFEPFVGGGALLFELRPSAAFISDANADLINVYTVIQQRVDALIKDLRKHKHSEEYYYKLRDADRRPSFQRWGAVSRASRLIYLNKTCFNGLYRVNSLGQFNVPFGRYRNPRWLDEENLRACSEALQQVKIAVAPFEAVLHNARKGDLVYFDPPYAPLNATSNFTAYHKEGFSSEDQRRLSEVCRKLDQRGVHFMLSNSSAPLIMELYQGFNIHTLQALRCINSKADKRGKIDEVLVTNYQR